MNPDLALLQQYPFERLGLLKQGLEGPDHKQAIAWSIGEPKHAAPDFVESILHQHLAGLGHYPSTRGSEILRQSICNWAKRRYQLRHLDAQRQILPVNGTREALFAFAQSVIDRSKSARVIMPNPFYQIYEGAALLAGAQPYYLNCLPENDYVPDLSSVPTSVWQQCQLIYTCSPGNPSGALLDLNFYRELLNLADQYDFVIASDECYSEIYLDETQPPLGLLQVCEQLGRDDYARCMVFNSLSKRSNLPGLRSGFVAGDSKLIDVFLLYRTYHGCAMSLTVQHVSATAWDDEAHVEANRRLYQEKFAAVVPLLKPIINFQLPQAGFFLWAEVPELLSDNQNDIQQVLSTQALSADELFSQQLFRQQHVTVLPGSYLARNTATANPGQGRVRMALVAPLADCIEAANRIVHFCEEHI